MVKTSLYRHFDADGRLLYVGISKNAVARLNGHSAKSWYGEIASVTIEHHKSRAHALYAEALAIQDEGPIYNKAQPIPRDPDAPKPKAPLVISAPKLASASEPKRLGYIFADRRFVEAQKVGLRHVGVPDEMMFVDVHDENPDQENLNRLMKSAQHKGTEVYVVFPPTVPRDCRDLLGRRGVKFRAVA